jgi:hypothetical protein
MTSSLRLRAAWPGLLLLPWLACQGAPTGGGADPGDSDGSVEAPGPARVVISELMYHPVLENDAEDGHEFIELHNLSDGPAKVSLAGWTLRLGGHDAVTFGSNVTLGPGAFAVVAKDRAKLIAAYGLPSQAILGEYTGALDNGGDTVELVDAAGALVDRVRYDDQFPWPIGADALGASAAWFPAGEYEKHQFKGRSLERMSFALPGTEPHAWEASPTGGGTPARANSGQGEPALVMGLAPRGAVVPAGQPITITVTMSPGALSEAAIEYFVDDLARSDEPRSRVDLGGAGPQYTATLLALPARSIVRYRVLGKRPGVSADVISPRPSDPYAFHTIFVQGDAAPSASAYQLFIAPARWSAMWTNLGGGPNAGCELNPSWDARVPAVLVRKGQVHDIQARYQGSRYQRKNGASLPPWPAGTGPMPPAELKALSWRLSFPAYDRWLDLSADGKKDRRQTVNLNKQNQACPGVLNQLSSTLQWAAGVRTQRMRFARLYVNGSYYHYMMEIENVDEDLLGKTEPDGALGDLFKSDGAVDDNQGPWGRGNFRPLELNSSCPARYSKLDRYRSTYERQSQTWKDASPAGHAELIDIVEALAPLYAAAKGDGNWQPVRAHLAAHFDVAQLINHWVVRNFAGAWDDGVHNFYLYKRASDGKFEVLPQDFDLEFGGDGGGFSKPPTASIYLGEEGIGLDPVGGSNALKSALIKAYRDEFRARFVALLKTVLAPANVMAKLAEIEASWDQQAWDESPAQGKCDVTVRLAAARTWLQSRYASLSQQGLM